MIATAAGPYEHAGPYQESELFDTSGTPAEFCKACEHAPCVAGFVNYCAHSPRFISTTVVVQDIEKLADAARRAGDAGGLWVALRLALGYLEGQAWAGGFNGDRSLHGLATIRRDLTDRVEPSKDES